MHLIQKTVTGKLCRNKKYRKKKYIYIIEIQIFKCKKFIYKKLHIVLIIYLFYKYVQK